MSLPQRALSTKLGGPLEIEVETLELDGVELEGDREAFAELVGGALARLVAQRRLPRALHATDAGEGPRGDEALAGHVAEVVWQQLVPPRGITTGSDSVSVQPEVGL